MRSGKQSIKPAREFLLAVQLLLNLDLFRNVHDRALKTNHPAAMIPDGQRRRPAEHHASVLAAVVDLPVLHGPFGGRVANELLPLRGIGVALANVVFLNFLFAVESPHPNQRRIRIEQLSIDRREKNARAQRFHELREAHLRFVLLRHVAGPADHVGKPAILHCGLKPAVEIPACGISPQFYGNDSRPRTLLREREERLQGFVKRGRFDKFAEVVADEILEGYADDLAQAAVRNAHFAVD